MCPWFGMLPLGQQSPAVAVINDVTELVGVIVLDPVDSAEGVTVTPAHEYAGSVHHFPELEKTVRPSTVEHPTCYMGPHHRRRVQMRFLDRTLKAPCVLRL